MRKTFTRIALAILFFSASLSVFADIPTNYYSAANNASSTNDALRIALYSIINSHTVIGYSSLPEQVYAASVSPSDFNNGASKTLEDIYSSQPYTSTDGGASATQCGTGWNKEHSFPKSWFGDSSPMYSDAFHIYPTDIRMNSARSNYPYGDLPEKVKNCDIGYGKGGAASYTSDGVGTTIFDPGDAGYKGDLARTYFYMVTCYRDKNLAQTAEAQVMVAYTNNVVEFTPYSINLLMKWHREDPVSQKERTRNDAIYVHQGNRNPFIDYPCLAEYLWGDSVTKNVDFEKLISSYDATFSGQGCPCELITNPTLTLPTTSTLNFTAVPNASDSQVITVKGVNLTSDITLTVSGTNASLFTISASSTTSAEGLVGKSITITYNPTAEASHTATLTISSAEVTSKVITLNGACSNTVVVPTISSPTFSGGKTSANITSFGGSASLTQNGIYYSTSNGFTDGSGTKLVATTAATTGTFDVDVSTLAEGTYYFKAFATNSAGTGYSTQGSFTITGIAQVAGGTPTLIMGKTVTNSFTCTNTTTLLLHISNLANSVNITSSNVGIVTVSPTTVSPEDAATGITLTITKVGNGAATITIAGDAVNKTINVTCQ